MAAAAHLVEYRWKPGQSGNPAGKQKGSRDRLESDFLYALAEHFSVHGKDAIERLCKDNPAGYIKAIVTLMPKRDEKAGLDDLGDDDLRFLLGLARLARERAEARAPGATAVGGTQEAAAPVSVPSVPEAG